ncbi:MAG: fructosamine kinase family protein [Ignavibacteriaceae bacterium]|nr:fructosamine kinase family protein [Ignavibacteriaceae bacterium]
MISVKSELEFNLKREFRSFRPLHGGSIASSFHAETTRGEHFFVKVYDGSNSYAASEVTGLNEIRKAAVIRTPDVIFSEGNLLVLEYISEGRSSNEFWERFGLEFAALHRINGSFFGFSENNFIGLTSQINTPSASWSDFYMTRRLLYQIKLAEKKGGAGSLLSSEFVKAEKRIRDITESYNATRSLLHGDLWSGNYLCGEGGVPVLIDPAVYYGDREADLAMTKLFGGFDQRFYSAYIENYPPEPGWQEREPVYKLYHVLNHYNLFGETYLNQALSILRKYTG